jgi:WD40 repeat protein
LSEIERTSALQILDQDLKPIGDGFPGLLQAGVTAATFSPGATFTAAIADDGSLRVFDTKSRTQTSRFNLQAPDIGDFAVSDSGLLVAAFNSGSLKCFDAKAGSILSTVERAHSGLIKSVAVSPNGKMVASLGYDCLIKLWSLPELKPLGSFDGVGVDPSDGTVLFLDDGRIAAGGLGGDVRVFQVKNEIDLNRWDGQPSASLVNPPLPQIQIPGNLSFTVNGSWGGMWLVDSKSHSIVWGYRLSSRASTIGYDEKNKELISTDQDGLVRRWKLP